MSSLDSQTLSTIGFISHGLRTPIHSALGYNRYLLDGLAGPLNEEQRHVLEGIRNGMTVLLDMVEDLLDLNVMQNGRFTVTLRPVCFPEVAKQATAILTPLAEAKHQTLRLRLDSDHMVVDIDERRILQVLLNLGSNAVKYAGEGAKITLIAYRESERLLCKVVDDGPGLSAEDQRTLFQPFGRTNTRASGNGLGLCICKGIIDAHDGKIGVDSEPGYGSTFWFSLPWSSTVRQVP